MPQTILDPNEQTLVDKDRIDGVVIGVFVGFDKDRSPLVAYPGNPHEEGTPAQCTTRLQSDDIGRDVALLFESGDPSRPVLIGKIERSHEKASDTLDLTKLEGDQITIKAGTEIVFKCGKASITLTKAGKIIVRGTYLLNRSSGVNKIKGASVQIN